MIIVTKSRRLPQILGRRAGQTLEDVGSAAGVPPQIQGDTGVWRREDGMEELTCPFPCTSMSEPSTVPGAQGPTGGPGPQMDGWLSVALEEYKSIRT
jgi:hypothetical protein